jgi:hypothetical protein
MKTINKVIRFAIAVYYFNRDKMNKLFLYLGVFFLYLVNHAKANEQAWWDDAQNYMEKLAKGERWQLKRQKDAFTILSQRAGERIGDIVAEKAT